MGAARRPRAIPTPGHAQAPGSSPGRLLPHSAGTASIPDQSPRPGSQVHKRQGQRDDPSAVLHPADPGGTVWGAWDVRELVPPRTGFLQFGLWPYWPPRQLHRPAPVGGEGSCRTDPCVSASERPCRAPACTGLSRHSQIPRRPSHLPLALPGSPKGRTLSRSQLGPVTHRTGFFLFLFVC